MRILLCAACGPTTEGRPRGDRNLLTQEELVARGYHNVYDAVEALRNNWLRPRGSDSFNQPSEVQVYLDSNRLGGVDALRGMNVNVIRSVRWFDGVTATGRWGVGHGAGVIYVSTLNDRGDAGVQE